MRALRERQGTHNTRCWADAWIRHFPGGRKVWAMDAARQKELGWAEPAECME